MKSQFFKIIPNQNGDKPIKPKFLWVEDPDEQRLAFIEFSSGSHFLNGTKEVVPALKEDPEFQSYIVADITQVQSEIDKLESLKEKLINAMR